MEQRDRLGLSIEEVSRELKVSSFYYYQIEGGSRGKKLSLALALQLILILKMDAFRFLEYENEHHKKLVELNREI
jgi:transcriptional regulator with XRE-family HTH domain